MIEDNQTKIITDPGKPEVVITRIFDAPRELVFKTITNPKLIPRWWGPKIYTTTVEKMDVRPGGLWRFVQRAPEGNEFAFNGAYMIVEPPSRLMYTFEYEGMPGHIALETVTLEEQDGRTKMIDKLLFTTIEDRDGMVKSGMESGVTESYQRFDELLEARETTDELDEATTTSDREIVITRIFNAPRDLVFEAWVNPDQLVKWWGPKGFTITIQKIDVKVGGVWSFIMHGPNGVDYPNTIVYDEIARPERLVYSHGGSDDEGTQFQSTVTFTELAQGTTKVTMRGLFKTAAGREQAVKEYRAIEGGNQTLERLGEHLERAKNALEVKSGYA